MNEQKIKVARHKYSAGQLTAALILSFFIISDCLADNSPIDNGSELNASLNVNAPATIEVVRGGYLSISNSDHITHTEKALGFRKDVAHSALRNFGVDYFDLTGNAIWLHYSGYKVLSFVDYAPSPGLIFSGGLGAGQLTLNDFFDVSYQQPKAIPLGRFKIDFSPAPLFFVRGEVANDFSFMGWLNTDKTPVVMTANSIFLEAEHFTAQKLQMRSNVKEIYFTDLNQQFIFDNLLLQEITHSQFSLSLGVGGGFTTFKDQIPGYWNPDNFANYGARAVVAYDFSKTWHTEGRFNLGVHQDRSGRFGKESAAEMHLEYHAKSGRAVRAVANLLDSEDGAWWRDDINLVAELPF